MIQITSEQQKESADIVLDAMREMQKVMHTYCQTYQTKVACANTIAALASSLETKPHFMFGDINSGMEDEV